MKQLISLFAIFSIHATMAQGEANFEKIDPVVYIALVSQKEINDGDHSYFPNHVAFRIKFPFEYSSLMTPWDFFKQNGSDTIISREQVELNSTYIHLQLRTIFDFQKPGYRIEIFSAENLFRLNEVQKEPIIAIDSENEFIFTETLLMMKGENASLPIYSLEIPFIYTNNSLIQEDKWDWLQHHISKWD